MFPRLGDFIHGIFGINLQIPVQTFGFFVALGFIISFLLIRRELRRKESLGHYHLQRTEIITEGPLPLTELIFPTLIWGFVAYKIGYAFVNYDEFYKDTQGVILSSKGWWVSGIGAVLLYGIPRYLSWKKSQSTPVKKISALLGPSYFMNLILVLAFFGGILGAKIFTYIEDLDAFWANPWAAIFSFDGLAWYGGLLLAAVVICSFFYFKGYKVLTCIDGFAPGLIVGYGIGRMGCHFSGDGDWGKPNLSSPPGWLSWLPDWAWAYDYPHNVVREGIPIEGCTGEFCKHLPQNVWPTPFYEVLMALMIFGALMLIRNKLKYPGQLTGIYMVLIGFERILVEQIRVNERYEFLGLTFTQAEAISVGMIAVGLGLFAWLTWKQKPAYPGIFPEKAA